MFDCKKGNDREMRKLLRIKQLNRMKCLQREWKWAEDASAKHWFKKAQGSQVQTAGWEMPAGKEKKISCWRSMACPNGKAWERWWTQVECEKLNVKSTWVCGRFWGTSDWELQKEFTESRSHSADLQSFVVVVDKINCAELHSAEEVAASLRAVPALLFHREMGWSCDRPQGAVETSNTH